MRARERKLAPIARHKTIRGEGSNCKDATTTGAGDSTTAPARRRKAATTGSAGADCTRCTPRWKGSARAYAPCVCEMEVHGSYIRTHETGRTSGIFRGRAPLASECDDEGTRGRGRHLQRHVMERGGTRLSSLRCKGGGALWLRGAGESGPPHETLAQQAAMASGTHYHVGLQGGLVERDACASPAGERLGTSRRAIFGRGCVLSAGDGVVVGRGRDQMAPRFARPREPGAEKRRRGAPRMWPVYPAPHV